MSSHWRLTVIAGLLISTSLALSSPVSAAHEPAHLGLTPVGEDGTYFDVAITAGETRDLQVEAANFGHEAAVARTYAANVYSIVNGGFGASLSGEPPAATTKWVTFPTQELTLAPGDAVVMDVRVAVPKDTPPGEYIAALVIENAEPIRGAGTVAVDQVNRSAIAIAIDVPGPREPAVAIGEVGHSEVAGTSVVTFSIDNPGNVHLYPTGEFLLRDDAGDQIASASPKMDSVYAGTSTLLELRLDNLLPPGQYCAELSLSDEGTGAFSSTQCLAFMVAAPAPEKAPADGLPSVTQVVDAVGGPMIVLPLLIAVVGIGALGVLFAWRRRRGPSAVADGPSSAWPIADTDAHATTLPEWLSGAAAPLQRVLRQQPRITRAWMIARESTFVLALEGAPGTPPAEAARLAAEVQELADREPSLDVPVRVVCLQGSGPVSRVTADAVPFYVRQPAT